MLCPVTHAYFTPHAYGGAFLITIALTAGVPGFAAAAPDGGASDDWIGQFDNKVTDGIPDSRQEAAELSAKNRLVNAHIAQKEATPERSAHASAANLNVGYQLQGKGHWCGPASVAMVTNYLGIGWHGEPYEQQKAAAELLGTDEHGGTFWKGKDNVPIFPGSSAYPIEDILDFELYSRHMDIYYMVQEVPSSGGEEYEAQYKKRLVYDIDDEHPMVLHQYSIPGFHFPWQPQNLNKISHYIVARGYSDNGDTTIINDPGWSAGENSSAPSAGAGGSVVIALGGRGYVF